MTLPVWVGVLRATFGIRRLIGAIFLLSILALSGCNIDDSPGPRELKSLQITSTASSVAIGTSLQLSAIGIYNDNSHTDLTTQVSWTTSNASIATIGAGTGRALGVAAGSATLTASFQGLTGSTTLTVTQASLVSIAITPPIPSIAPGASQQFTATGTFSDNTVQNLTTDLGWTSSNTAVATVSSGGLAGAVASGTVTITAICKMPSICGNLAGSASLIVTSATLVSIAITPAAPSIALGTSQTFTATGAYSDHSTHDLTTQVTWHSATPAVATINNSVGLAGVATPVATGTTLITAVLGGTTSAAVTLTVTPATLVSIAITPSAASIALGTGETFTATGTYSDNSTHDLTTQVTWSSATLAVATISNAAGSAGVATTVATGTSLITAALGSTTSAAVTFTVTPATLVSIAITPTGPSISVVATEQFVATGTYSDNSTQILTTAVTWASSAPSIAVISNAAGSEGLATGLMVGSTSISAALGGVTSPSVTLSVMAQVESVLYSFAGGNDGATPVSGLIQAADGNFYGTTPYGGANAFGTVFKITPAGVESVLYSFAGGNDGANPYAGLIQAADGNFYGTTTSGGASSAGTVFKITPAGVETVLYSFLGGTDGASPFSGLIQPAGGDFYGTTEAGGTSSMGTVFKITAAGVESVLYSFAGGTDGANPAVGLTAGSDGNFYGTTFHGGSNNTGTVFKVTLAGVETVQHSFTSGNDGDTPVAGLIQAADGSLYGTTLYGGTSSDGTVFKVTLAGAETVLYSFTGGNDGGAPVSGLIQGADGNFYGTAQNGGTGSMGTIFKLTPAGVESVLYSFAGGTDAANPFAGLIQATDGNFYGTTQNGGTDSEGTVFKF